MCTAKQHVQVQFFFSILCWHICRIICTCFCALMFSSSVVVMCWKITGKSNIFFYNSCGTLIWVENIPVKVDQSLIGILPTYKIIRAVLLIRPAVGSQEKIQKYFFSKIPTVPKMNSETPLLILIHDSVA